MAGEFLGGKLLAPAAVAVHGLRNGGWQSITLETADIAGGSGGYYFHI